MEGKLRGDTVTPGEQGRLGEAKLVAYFVEQGYSVYHPLFGNTSFDLIIEKDRVCQTVQVKSVKAQTKSGSWQVKLCTVYNTTQKNVQKNFDSKGVDLIGVYIIPEDRVVIFPAVEYDGRSSVSIPRKINSTGSGSVC